MAVQPGEPAGQSEILDRRSGTRRSTAVRQESQTRAAGDLIDRQCRAARPDRPSA
jgi:hypothetical protein